MFERRIPEWLRHAPAPSMQGFALLAGVEAVARGLLVSVFPVALLQATGDAQGVSLIYFVTGILSLVSGLFVPWLNRFVPRRQIYAGSALLYIAGALAAAQGGTGVIAGLLCVTVATVSLFVCFNAYVLDYIDRARLGRCETLRMFYSALGWTVGPLAGVVMMQWWAPAPFVASAVAMGGLLAMFVVMRLGNGKLIARARGPATNPVRYIRRFLAQPRLVVGWSFAVVRSCGWWAYIVYLPIYAIESGLDPQTGGIMTSLTNAMLFVTPFMLRLVQRSSVRFAVRIGFGCAGLLFILAAFLSSTPTVGIAVLFAASAFLVLLDICAGLPFLMAVKPSERTEMSAVYSSYRDVSGILTPGAAWLVLLVAPLSGIFAFAGLALGGCWALAATLHPRLGSVRLAAPRAST